MYYHTSCAPVSCAHSYPQTLGLGHPMSTDPLRSLRGRIPYVVIVVIPASNDAGTSVRLTRVACCADHLIQRHRHRPEINTIRIQQDVHLHLEAPRQTDFRVLPTLMATKGENVSRCIDSTISCYLWLAKHGHIF